MSFPFRPSDAVAYRDAFQPWLAEHGFQVFITLATNFATIGPDVMHALLREWDARSNRFLLQSNWARRKAERLFWIAFLEKAGVNPHWHLLLRFRLDPSRATDAQQKRMRDFPDCARRTWCSLVPSGAFDMQPICNTDVTRYVTKEMIDSRNRQNFVISTEFH